MSGWTLQSLIDGEMSVHAYCQKTACGHHADLDLPAIRDRLGPDTPAMADDLKDRMKCGKCGGKKLGFIYTHNSTKKMLPYKTPWTPG